MNLPETRDDLLAYVESQLSKMPKFYVIDPKNIDMKEVKKAMLTWNEIYERLTAIEIDAKMKLTKAKEDYDIFFNQRYTEIAKRENTNDKKASKWLSSTEIERLVKVEYTKDYLFYKEKVDVAETMVAYLRRRLESWQSYNFILANIAKIEGTKVTISSPQEVYNNLGANISNPQIDSNNIFTE